jgi:hypothetical protein
MCPLLCALCFAFAPTTNAAVQWDRNSTAATLSHSCPVIMATVLLFSRNLSLNLPHSFHVSQHVASQLLPVYNYDYVLDHIFHLNGAVELRGSTSGYLQSTFWYAQRVWYLAWFVCVVSSGTYDPCQCSVAFLKQFRRTVSDGTGVHVCV